MVRAWRGYGEIIVSRGIEEAGDGNGGDGGRVFEGNGFERGEGDVERLDGGGRCKARGYEACVDSLIR